MHRAKLHFNVWCYRRCRFYVCVICSMLIIWCYVAIPMIHELIQVKRVIRYEPEDSFLSFEASLTWTVQGNVVSRPSRVNSLSRVHFTPKLSSFDLRCVRSQSIWKSLTPCLFAQGLREDQLLNFNCSLHVWRPKSIHTPPQLAQREDALWNIIR